MTSPVRALKENVQEAAREPGLPARQADPLHGRHVTSEGMDGAAAFALWCQLCSPVIDVALPDPQAESDFAFALDLWSLDEIRIGTTRSKAQTARRSSVHVAAAGHDQILLQYQLAGGHAGDFMGRPVEVGPGDILLVDMARPYESRASDFYQMNVAIPRALLQPVASHLFGAGRDTFHGLVFRAGETATELLSAQLRWVLDALHRGQAVDAAAVRRILIGSLSGLVQGLPPEAASATPTVVAGPTETRSTGAPALARLRGTLLSRALSEIEARLADPTLSVAELSRAVAVSRTSLYRLFEPLGGVTAHIRTRRLQAALLDLVADEGTRLPVRSIALKWHFSSEGAFSRIFKAHFGVQPSHVRAGLAERPRIGIGHLLDLSAALPPNDSTPVQGADAHLAGARARLRRVE